MKRIIALILICFILTSCGKANSEPEYTESADNISDNANYATGGVWLSFSELKNMLLSENGFEKEVTAVADNCKKLRLENIYIHVRSHCDSIFKSDFFPLTEAAASYDYDIFEYMINIFHANGIKVHAWINPYRVSTATSDITQLRADSPVHKWLNDVSTENDKNICIYNGIYLNPAEENIRRLVIDGIREIATKYSVDGIHFDDYFYPTTDASFDSASYEEYTKVTKKPLSLSEWRKNNVNLLISGCYSAIKYINKDITFSISPAASIENNLTELYADVEHWVKNGYVDCIIPQLYFGFEYPLKDFRFEKLLKDWKKLMSCNSDVELLIGLASYKIGTDASADSEEWQNKTDIIARQVELCFYDGQVSGYVLFSYSSVFSDNPLNLQQRENLLKFNEGV
jgi:uncharacterized lipoprotein YddW (UPF0748 family)